LVKDGQPCLRSLIGAGLLGAAAGPVFLALSGLVGNPKGGSIGAEALWYAVVVCGAYAATAAGLAVRSVVRSQRLRWWRWAAGLLLTGPAYGAAAAHAWFPQSGPGGLTLGAVQGALCAGFGGLAVLAVARAAANRHAEPAAAADRGRDDGSPE
jgi:hypothetical protein